MLINPNLESLVEYRKEVDSTNYQLNLYANCKELPPFFTLWAEFQSAGRGQRENRWESEAGKNLTFSTLLYPKAVRANQQFLLSQWIAICIQSTLSNYTEGITIKWPNDIYYHQYKICGTLIENDLQGIWINRSIAGIGINLNQENFYSNAPNPISLRQILGYHIEREKFLHELLQKISEAPIWIDEEKEDKRREREEWIEKLQKRYFKLQYRSKGMHRYSDSKGEFMARLIDILPDGHLVLKDESDELRKYGFKEVSYL
ncbi:MAG: biotin--[acetyl-CoA-carboxylase] ligase [Phocaeicola sp.]